MYHKEEQLQTVLAQTGPLDKMRQLGESVKSDQIRVRIPGCHSNSFTIKPVGLSISLHPSYSSMAFYSGIVAARGIRSGAAARCRACLRGMSSSSAVPEGLDDRPLAGIKVVDLTRVLAGPLATMMLVSQPMPDSHL